MDVAKRTPEHHLSLEERRRRAETRWRRALLVSLGVHALLFVLFLAGRPLIPPSPFAAAGPMANDALAAAGGMQAITIRMPEPQQIRRPPPPLPTPTFEPVEVVEFDEVPQVEVQQAQVAGELPLPDIGPGVTDGQGRGDGGTTEEGRFRLVPPTPRGMIMPPTNRKLRGREVEVWVFVDTRGRVVADSTRLAPPTSDRDFNRRLIREAAEWVFTPGRRGTEAVASWFPYKISM